MLNPEIKKSIKQSVLCWLATSSADNVPNVSPKEMFTHYGDNSVIIANIASPQSVKNIKENPQVCISFIEVFIQKGFQLKGKAAIISAEHTEYEAIRELLMAMTQEEYPFKTITKIQVESVKPIIAPSYRLFPELTEEERMANTYKTYGVRKI